MFFAGKFLTGEFVAQNDFTKTADRLGKYLMHTDKLFAITPVIGDSIQTGKHWFWDDLPRDVKIVSARFKADNPEMVVVVLSTGVTLLFQQEPTHPDGRITWDVVRTAQAPRLAGATKIIGDAVYALRQGKVYASFDTI